MSSRAKLRGSDVAFAQHDPATALASIFRPVCRGRRPMGLRVDTEFHGFKLMFTCWEWLDTRDQSILLAAVGMAGIDSAQLSAKAPGDLGKQLWSDLKPENEALKGMAVVLDTTYYALLDAAGLPKRGADYERVRDILYRLSQVGCRVKKDGYDWSMRLLSYASRPDGTIHIALNQRFAEALAGQNVRVSLDERRQLKSDAAQVLHAWLSASVRAGKSGVWMGLDAIALRVWGVEASSDGTRRKRRHTLCEALKEIESLGWKVEHNGSAGARHQVRVTRPKIIEG